jgi:hypothetical protein
MVPPDVGRLVQAIHDRLRGRPVGIAEAEVYDLRPGGPNAGLHFIGDQKGVRWQGFCPGKRPNFGCHAASVA